MKKNPKSTYEKPRVTIYALKPGKALLQGSNDLLLLNALGGRGEYDDGGDPFAELI